ncbi:MAG: radical SAM family heme chaperone HemW [Deltaproteobacteria bacterium]|nr:radical SAM family heme chaperone HemW [Deltaproteobacteria bacterium]
MKPPGLYVHIPFCRSKCPYCAFFSVPSTSLIPRWLEAFKKEVVYYKDQFKRFDSLYLGGGTPTWLETGALSSLMDCIRGQFDFDASSEMTIEANPCDVTREKMRALKDMGFNRVSLGVQSFDDRALSLLGRRHRAEHNEKAIRDLRSSGFENISMDILYGFEGQSTRDVIHTLRKAISCQPEHLSCYQLTIEKKTLFWKLRERGVSLPLREEDERAFFLATSQFLEENGYMHYEISSFAREAGYRSRHNMKYWQHAPYLGLGPSAHSFHASRRWWNVASVRRYCAALERGRAPVEDSENLSNEQLEFESIMLGLRTRNGFDQKRVSNNHQSREMLAGLRNSGFLNIANGRVAPTRKGFLMADYLATCLGPIP